LIEPMLYASSFPTLIAAGAINAGFAVPMKFMRKWPWENIWLVWALFALLILPLGLGVLAIPGFTRLFLPLSAPVLTMALFGALWGMGQVLFGIALEAIGISLATAIMLGVSIAVGTLVPLIVSGGNRLSALRVVALIAAVGLAVAGVALCARAGQRLQAGTPAPRRGITYAVGAGLGAGLFNFSMAFGGTLMAKAARAGSQPAWAQLAAWTPFLLAGAVMNVGYCGVRLLRGKTYRQFAVHGTISYWLRGILMAVLWLGSALLYGVAVRQMGNLGAVFAWPVYMSLIVLGTAAAGLLAGEWRAASRSALLTMSGGLAVLVVAVFAISRVQHGW
jgi:L-rhamnose-H+ transport protein